VAALAALPASALADSATPGATSAATGPATPAKAPPRPDKVLSNETTFTTWSIADRYIAIRRRPASNAPGFARLKAVTADGFLQSYILLRERFTSTGPWILLRAPGRPNGRTGWVPRKALDSFSVTHMSILVNREAHNLTLYRNGHVVLRFPVGVGKPSTPTPGGHFWITESFSSSDAFYGPWAFATSDFSVLSEWPGGGIVGLHGTNEPALIPGDPSHGCIRLRNSDVRRLIPLVHIGTPLHIV
jgi:lipoprotein-anchoring transpeptidase ErfK/SrfK